MEVAAGQHDHFNKVQNTDTQFGHTSVKMQQVRTIKWPTLLSKSCDFMPNRTDLLPKRLSGSICGNRNYICIKQYAGLAT